MSDDYTAPSESSASPGPAGAPPPAPRVLRVVEDARRGLAPAATATDQTETGRVRTLVVEARTPFRRRRSYAVVEDDPSALTVSRLSS
jgi:hypothetical protein